MAQKALYPPAKKTIRLGRGRPANGTSTYTHEPPYLVSVEPCQRVPRLTREQLEEIRRRSRERPLNPPSRRELALLDRLLEKLGVEKRERAEGTRSADRAIFVFELVPPYREARIGIVLHALNVPWLKEKGDLTIRENRVYAGENIVAKIIFCRRRR
jgi:hypothetical protein